MKYSILTSLILFLVVYGQSAESKITCLYPAHWWEAKLSPPLKWWEISPASVKCENNKVVLSKRNELGILSNFAPTPFILDGIKYASLEGFWQMMKFPKLKDDPRYFELSKTPYTRESVSKLTAFEAKKAGDTGSEVMKKLGINWVTYQGKRLVYKTPKKAAHYQLIKRAMQEKLNQNLEVQKVLKATENLKLLPDHEQKANTPPAWKYNEIWMELRDTIR